MGFYGLVYVATIVVGFTVAGLARELWWLATGEALTYQLDGPRNLLFLLRVTANFAALPMHLLLFGLRLFMSHPLFGGMVSLISLLWGFIQGVVVLTRVFNFL